MVAKNEAVPRALKFPETEKVRSILHLKKAIREELYEACDFWITRAMTNGASKREISWILRHPYWNIEESSRN